MDLSFTLDNISLACAILDLWIGFVINTPSDTPSGRKGRPIEIEFLSKDFNFFDSINVDDISNNSSPH